MLEVWTLKVTYCTFIVDINRDSKLLDWGSILRDHGLDCRGGLGWSLLVEASQTPPHPQVKTKKCLECMAGVSLGPHDLV